MSRPWGGDTIETVDGRIGTITSTMYSLIGKQTEYAFRFPGETVNPRFDTGPDGKYESGDRSHRAYESEVKRVVAYGRHDYYPDKEKRGYCEHCGARKRDHGDGSREVAA